jgi:hypothetical protein
VTINRSMRMKKHTLSFFAAGISLFLLWSCAALERGFVLPGEHPDPLPDNTRPICTDCHEPRDEFVAYEQYDHTVLFLNNHKPEASQHPEICSVCHMQQFCSDCHGVGIELKPSRRHPTDIFRRTPHRGDYLSRHRIEGRINPTSCFRCHGNPKTARTCVKCHG